LFYDYQIQKPLAREWAIFALKQCLDENEASQSEVASLRLQVTDEVFGMSG
jgi:hypothetical protein